MKYPARLLYFFGLLVTTYVVLPVVFFIFQLVYLIWNLHWIPKDKMRCVTSGWQEVHVGGNIACPSKIYRNPFDYLRKKEKE